MSAAYGQSGETTIVVEAAFGESSLVSPAAATWTDITADVRAWETDRGRNHELRRFESGTLEMTLDNTGGHYTAGNTAGDNYPDVVPGVPVRIVATYDTTEYPVWYGYVEAWPLEFPGSVDNIVQVRASDLFRLLADADHSDSLSAELSSDRVETLLDDYGVPSTLQDAGTGVVELPALTTQTSTVLAELQRAELAELGQLFVAADGKVTLQNRYAREGLSAVDTFGPSDIVYFDPEISFDDTNLFNEATVTHDDGTDTDSDSTSITQYGKRTLAITQALEDTNYGPTTAAELVRRYKDPLLRVQTLTVAPAAVPSYWATILGAEISDMFTVEKTMPGDDIDEDILIERITHSSPEAGVWLTTFELSPYADLGSIFTLGTSELDGSDILGY